MVNEILKVKDAQRKKKLLLSMYNRWVQLDMQAALDSAIMFKEQNKNDGVLDYVLITSGKIKFPVVYKWLMARIEDEGEKKVFTNMLFYEVARDSSPAFVLTYINLIENDVLKEGIMRVLIEQWAARDLASSLSWLQTQTLPESLQGIEDSLLARSAQQEEQESIGDMIRQMNPGKEKFKKTRDYAHQLAGTDIQTATDWARSLDDPKSYKIALSVVFEAWVKQEPDKARIFEELLAESDPDVRDHLLNEVSLDIASSNPKDLADMIEMVPTSAQPEIAEKVVRFWRGRNPQETVDWVRGLNTGTTRDHATVALTDHLLNIKKFDQVIELVSKVQDKQKQYEASVKIFERMYQYSPEQAKQAMDGADYLSAEQREQLSTALDNTKR